MNTYECSNGARLTKREIDRKIREAKKIKIDSMEFIHCEQCKVNSGTWFDCSHIISVKEAQESGRSELAWAVENIELLCRECHIKVENLTKKQRQERFEAKGNSLQRAVYRNE